MKIFQILTAVLFLALGMPLGAADNDFPKIFTHSGKRLAACTQNAAEKEIAPGYKYLVLKCSFRLKNNPSGFNYTPVVRLHDDAGKIIQELRFGHTNLLPRPDDPQIVDGLMYIQPSAKAKKASFAFLFYGNAGEIEMLNCDFSFSRTPEAKPPVKFPRFHDPAVLNDKKLDEMLAKMVPVQAEIRRCGEYNGLFINGKEIAPAIYYGSYYKDKDNSNFNMDYAFHKKGMNLFSVTFTLGIASPDRNGDVWQGPGKYDITPIIRDIRSILKQVPDAKILLNFGVNQHRGYAKAHPEEVFTNAKGLYNVTTFGHSVRSWSKEIVEDPTGEKRGYSAVSEYSRPYQLAAAKAIEDVCALVAAAPEGKAVAMVYLNGGRDGQWLQQWDNTGELADYSPACMNFYQEFLLEKYRNSEAELRKAWKKPDASFTRLRVPLRDEWWNKKKAFHTLHQENSEVHDFCEFLAWGFAKRHSLWCKAVKKGSGGRWVTGAYHRASGLRGFPQFPLLSLNYLIDDPNVDLVINVPSYERTVYKPVHQSGYDGSLLLHKKMQITELDLRTGEIVYFSLWRSPFWSAHNPPEKYDTEVQRFAASAIEKGGTFHAYDMNGGWFSTQNALNSWGKACNLLKERTALPWNNRHIGLFSSENFWHYQSLGKNRMVVYAAVENPAYALYRTGVPNKIYLLDELFGHKAKEFKAPKVMIFLNAGSMTVQQADQLRKEYGKDHRVIVWHWAPGMFTTDGDKNIEKITGFQLRRMTKEMDLTLTADEKSRDPLLRGVKGYLMPTVQHPAGNRGISYEVTDKDAVILARYAANGLPGMAVKRYKNHTEVYIGSPCGLTPQLCRNFAVEAGMTPFLNTDDFCGFNAGLLYVSALTPGKKSITLPEGFVLDKVLTKQKVNANGQKADLEMKVGELLILKLKPTQKQGDKKR